MASGRKDLEISTANNGMTAFTAAARAQQPWPQLIQEQTDLTGAELLTAFKKADAAAAAAPSSRILRAKAVYAYAIHRDQRYGSARGRFFRGLGYHNAFRSLYEGARIPLDWAPGA